MSRPQCLVLGLMTLASFGWATACGDATEPSSPPEPPRAAAITVNPATIEFTALGMTTQLSAEVRDQNGRVMAGVTVTWASSSVAVATVDVAGLVTSAGNGTVTITATAGAASGATAVTVAQEVQGIEVLPAAETVSAGDTVRLDANAWDANGHMVPGSEFTWSSSDTAVAAVDGSGLVHGFVEGAVTITATSQSVEGAAQVRVAHQDWAPLMVFYEATRGEGWIANDGWMSDLPIGQWHGVTTGPDGHVTVLRLSASDLVGPIPPELGALSRLETLDLERNTLRGRIPPELGKLVNLKSLILGVNRLSGPIPSELGDLASLEVLRLRRNNLTGPIPPELGKLRNLARLGLDRNFLAGPMPSELLGLERLRLLHFADNETLCAPGSREFATWLAQLDVYVGPLCNEGDRRTLAALHKATEGADWTHSNGWLSDDLLDEWHGVDTDSLGRVAVLDLSGNDLAGRVPASLAELASMKSLRLDGNAGLTGPLPLSLSALPLQELRYADTEVCVPPDESFGEWLAAIPSHWGTDAECAPLSDRETLESLYSATGGADWKNDDNWLSDRPLGRWHGVSTDNGGRVVELLLPANNLVGSIPPELGDLGQLRELGLAGNHLSGTIPSRLGNLSGLHTLILNGNNLTGPIPPELGNLLHLSELDLSLNDLTGPVPAELGSIPGLQQLNLAWNELAGPIPAELGNLSGLWWLILAGNRLTGPIPPELGGMSSLSALYLDGNMLTGSIPAELGTITSLKALHLSSNGLTGSIPRELGTLPLLVALLLSGNHLTGPIPPGLGNLSALEDLTLGGNELTGPIPPELGNLSNLRVLLLDGNELTGPVPPELGGLSRLRTLYLHDNQLTGPIPPEIGSLSGVWTLYLDRNELTGAVPPEFGGLSRLQSLSVMDNQLTGSLPPELGGLTRLRRLHLTNNGEMSGALPPGLTTLSSLEELLLGGTGLCAPNDADFEDWMSGVRLVRVRPCGAGAGSHAYLTQAVQSLGLPVPLLAGRPALLRVFPTTPRPTSVGIPKVLATFYVDGVEIHTAEIPGSNTPIPTGVEEAEGALEKSANATIPESVIQPGLEMVIEIDPDGTLDPELGVTRRVPETGRAPVHVEEVPALDLTVVPFQWATESDSSIVDIARAMVADPNTHELLSDTRALLPVGDLDVKAHGAVLTSTNNVVDLLVETYLIRSLEGGSGYYMGIMPESIVGGESGVAFIGVGAGFSAANSFVVAHELGHNLSLYHAPCGGAIGADRAFPHDNGAIGAWGYDFRGAGALVPPGARDLMSYCGPPRWVSDYSFARALGHRLANEGSASASAGGPVAAPTRSLLLWGGVDAQGDPFLEPAFVVEAPPTIPRSSGDYQLTGRTESGDELFSLSFDMMEMADGDGRSSFVFALPARADWIGTLESMTLAGPDGSATMDRTTHKPMTILRDPDTGTVRGILRGEDAEALMDTAVAVHLTAARMYPTAARVELHFSRGMPDTAEWRP